MTVICRVFDLLLNLIVVILKSYKLQFAIMKKYPELLYWPWDLSIKFLHRLTKLYKKNYKSTKIVII